MRLVRKEEGLESGTFDDFVDAEREKTLGREEQEQAMFGDYFCQNGTYVEGVFYGNHMKYLRGSEDSELVPPDEFKTRRQFAQKKRLESGILAFGIKFQEKTEKESEEARIARKLRTSKTFRVNHNRLFIEHFSSTRMQDWARTIEAGVEIWTNKSSGEVSTLCPWDPEPEERRRPRSLPATISTTSSACSPYSLAATTGGLPGRQGLGSDKLPRLWKTSPGLRGVTFTSDLTSELPPVGYDDFSRSLSGLTTSDRDVRSAGVGALDRLGRLGSFGSLGDGKSLGMSLTEDEEYLLAEDEENEEQSELGTGSLVYESDLDSFLSMLDTMK
ncbi:hypothetical protein B484DRAFT_419305 [Ochromonadaceae sp. CCMP2298]|nr:hypothetical protein B484DRAFT_419305 [Ochromonadaceae sp. CCMP2298]